MWLLGLLIGAGFGAVFGHTSEGALAGLAAGLWLAGKPPKPLPGDLRWRALEDRLAELERSQALLAARLGQLQSGATATDTAPIPNNSPAGASPNARAPEPGPVAAAIPGQIRLAPPNPEISPIVANRSVSPSVTSDGSGTAGVGSAPLSGAPRDLPDSAGGPPANSAADPLADFWQRLISGNLLAKIGVALLFFGVASALKLAAEQGWFPPGLRLLLGGMAGATMLGFGWSRREDEAHRGFGQILEGGGCGLLYLMVYFALSWYGLIGHGFAFVLFALLGLGCTLLALAQEAPMLAVFGLAGAFLAPILAASGSGSHIVLFSYYLLLNASILGLAWFRNWRALNVTGFLFTFLVGLAWAIQSYRPEHYLSTQVFLVLFFLLYSATPTLFARFRAPGRAAWDEALLLFGTPVAAILLQAPLVADTPYGLAWSAGLAGLYYLGLWASMANRMEPALELARVAQFGISLGFLTLAVPLALGAAATVAIWAVEGAATLWLSLRLTRPAGQSLGLLVQCAAGLWLLAHGPDLMGGGPLTNGFFTSGLAVALAGLASAGLLRTGRPAASLPGADLALAWGLGWWFVTGLHEIDRFAAADARAALGLLLVTATGLASEILGRRRAWPGLRLVAAAILPAAALAVTSRLLRETFILSASMAPSLILALAGSYGAMWRRERDGLRLGTFDTALHLGGAWLLSFVLTHDAVNRAEIWAGGRSLWPALALGLVPAGLLAGVILAHRRRLWPLRAPNGGYPAGFLQPLALLLAAWFGWTSLTEPGGGLARYLPGIDPLDVGLLTVLATLAATFREAPLPGRAGPRLLLLLVFLGLSGLAARLAHHFGGVAFTLWALLGSALTQALLSLLWSLLSMSLMISGARSRSRERWFAGFGLLALVGGKLLLVDLIHSGTLTWTASLIGIALLVLAAAYFAPMPPKTDLSRDGTDGVSG